jgi:hypothetical protein
MKVAFHIILTCLLLSSCTPTLMLFYGIKQPGIENEQSIKKKAIKFGLDTSNIVTISSEDYAMFIDENGVPDAAIFDTQGSYIEYRSTDTSCNAGLYDFIPNLNLNNEYVKPGGKNLESELLKFRDLKGHSLATPNKADFYLLIHWTVWSGRLNKDHVKIWEDLAKENRNCVISIIKVNLDMQEYWDESEKITISKKN